MKWKIIFSALYFLMTATFAQADEIAELSSSIVDLRSIMEARLNGTFSNLDDVREAATVVSRSAGRNLACDTNDESNVEVTAGRARDLILLAFLATSSAEQLSLPFFENQVRVGLREGCAGTSDADAIQSAEARIAETIGLIFEVQAEIRDREAQLLRLLRER